MNSCSCLVVIHPIHSVLFISASVGVALDWPVKVQRLERLQNDIFAYSTMRYVITLNRNATRSNATQD